MGSFFAAGHAHDVLDRIREALRLAETVLASFTPGDIATRIKSGDDPVTEADLAVDRELRRWLPRDGEGWLSEETADRGDRLRCSRVWIVDPIDGTREFVAGVPEWCVSVGYVSDGEAVAGGVLNPVTGEMFLGSVATGLTLNGTGVRVRGRATLEGAEVLASRSEVRRGEWARFEHGPVRVRPVGSIAYKLALVAAGRADATWTLVPKREWDVAAGTALVLAAGGSVRTRSWLVPRFNEAEDTLVDGIVAADESLLPAIAAYVGIAE